jgi:Flp pilus assembly protein TadG
MLRKFHSAARLLRNRSGNVIVEFAIIIPGLLALIVFLVEGSFQLLTEALLQYGLREATRFGTTGQPYPPNMAANPPPSREAAIPLIIASYGAGLIKPSNLTVTMTGYSTFNAIGTPGAGTSGAGGPAAVVQYQVSYYQPWLFSGTAYPAVAVTKWSGIQHGLQMVVQNEAFPTK